MNPLRSVTLRVALALLLGAAVGVVLHEAGRYRQWRFPAQLASNQICPDDRLYAGFTAQFTVPSNVAYYDGGSWAAAGSLISNVVSMAAFNQQLYVAGNDHVYRCDAQSWQDLGAGDAAGGFIYALANYNGQLYTGKFGGHVDRYDPVAGWADLGQIDPTTPKVESLVVFNGLLYAGAGDRVFSYDGECWVQVGGPFPGVDSIASLAVSGNKLYAGAGNNAGQGSGHVYRYVRGTSWDDLGQLGSATAVRSLAEFAGELFAGTTSPDGGHVFVFRSDAWVDVGSLLASVTSFASYHGDLFASTANQAGSNVFRWDGTIFQPSAIIGGGVLALSAPTLPALAPASASASSQPAPAGYCCNPIARQCDPAF